MNTVGFSTGNSGPITINTQNFSLTGGSTLNSSILSGSAGQGGSITIQGLASPAESVLIDGHGSGVFTDTKGTGAGGNIFVNANTVALQNGASVSASSTGTGNAGNILINAGQNYTSTDSAVTTQAAQASGGNITVLATDTVQLTNSQLNASVQGSSTTVGGNITIDPQYVILQNSQILAQATQGQGGAISITITNGGLFLPDATSTVSASSQFGVNGTVTIQSPNAPGSGKIQPLGKTPLLATSLLNQRCAALAGGEFSSFTVAGRDSLPTEPASWLASPLYAAGVGEGQGMRGEGREGETPILSLRQIAPAGFLTQTFALDWSAGCTS
jgi:large exoprotein involved in heme utilization and adhesion